MKAKYLVTIGNKEVYIKSDKALSIFLQIREHKNCSIKTLKN